MPADSASGGRVGRRVPRRSGYLVVAASVVVIAAGMLLIASSGSSPVATSGSSPIASGRNAPARLRVPKNSLLRINATTGALVGDAPIAPPGGTEFAAVPPHEVWVLSHPSELISVVDA